MNDQWSSLGADELLRAAVGCPDLGSASSDWPERYGQALAQGLGLAFYLCRLPGHDHIEVRTYGGPHADHQAMSPPSGHTLVRPHGALASFIVAFRGEDLNNARPDTLPDPAQDKAQETEASQDVTDDDESEDDEPGDFEDDELGDEDQDDEWIPEAFTMRHDEQEALSLWPAVQHLNARRARQFLLTAFFEEGGRREARLCDRLLAAEHGLAFYARTDGGRRELVARHYGGPSPRVLPAVPPQVLEPDWDDEEAWELVATYEGSELFRGDWRHDVSSMPLESILTVHISATAGEEVEYALRVSAGALELVKRQGSAAETITVLGTVAPGSDPLRIALDAIPDLLTFPPTAAVDITTITPHTVADAIGFSSSPEGNQLHDLYGDDYPDEEDERNFGYFDNLTPLRLHINRKLHLAANLGDDWVTIPMMEGRFPGLALNREFVSIRYDFDGGGISSGSGTEMIGEVRPGLNASWDDFAEEMLDRDLTLSRDDLPVFAAGQLYRSRFEANALETMIGGLDHIPAFNVEDEPEGYEGISTSLDFEPRGEEGLLFLRTLLNLHGLPLQGFSEIVTREL